MKNKIISVLIGGLISTNCFAMQNETINNLDKLTHKIKTEHIQTTNPINKKDLKIAFDVTTEKSLSNALRFIDMNLEAGVKPSDLHVAVVIHGGAGRFVLKDSINENLYLLLNSGVAKVIVCGQTIKRGLKEDDLVKNHIKDGIEIKLSAMNAFIDLQNDGYVINPF